MTWEQRFERDFKGTVMRVVWNKRYWGTAVETPAPGYITLDCQGTLMSFPVEQLEWGEGL